jgi:hypothetical protein
MRKDVREFIRRLEAAGLAIEPTPGHYRVLRDGKPLRKANGMPFMLPFSPLAPCLLAAATVVAHLLEGSRPPAGGFLPP